jgi:hypothetical protein
MNKTGIWDGVIIWDKYVEKLQIPKQKIIYINLEKNYIVYRYM